MSLDYNCLSNSSVFQWEPERAERVECGMNPLKANFKQLGGVCPPSG